MDRRLRPGRAAGAHRATQASAVDSRAPRPGARPRLEGQHRKAPRLGMWGPLLGLVGLGCACVAASSVVGLSGGQGLEGAPTGPALPTSLRPLTADDVAIAPVPGRLVQRPADAAAPRLDVPLGVTVAAPAAASQAGRPLLAAGPYLSPAAGTPTTSLLPDAFVSPFTGAVLAAPRALPPVASTPAASSPPQLAPGVTQPPGETMAAPFTPAADLPTEPQASTAPSPDPVQDAPVPDAAPPVMAQPAPKKPAPSVPAPAVPEQPAPADPAPADPSPADPPADADVAVPFDIPIYAMRMGPLPFPDPTPDPTPSPTTPSPTDGATTTPATPSPTSPTPQAPDPTAGPVPTTPAPGVEGAAGPDPGAATDAPTSGSTSGTSSTGTTGNTTGDLPPSGSTRGATTARVAGHRSTAP